MSDTELLLKSEPVRRVEVFTGAGRRRPWTTEQKLRIVSESYAAGETVSAVAWEVDQIRHGRAARPRDAGLILLRAVGGTLR